MIKKIKKVIKKTMVKATDVLVFMLVLPSVSFADATTADINSIVEKATGYLQGGVAKTMGIAAIVIAGYLCIAKQMFPKMMFMMILIGLGLIFGASSLYTTFVG